MLRGGRRHYDRNRIRLSRVDFQRFQLNIGKLAIAGQATGCSRRVARRPTNPVAWRVVRRDLLLNVLIGDFYLRGVAAYRRSRQKVEISLHLGRRIGRLNRRLHIEGRSGMRC
jgi:hypothetical protein